MARPGVVDDDGRRGEEDDECGGVLEDAVTSLSAEVRDMFIVFQFIAGSSSTISYRVGVSSAADEVGLKSASVPLRACTLSDQCYPKKSGSEIGRAHV